MRCQDRLGAHDDDGRNQRRVPTTIEDDRPPKVREAGLAEVVPGERICRSWLLLFGVIPVDYDDLVLESIGPGTEFHERSTMLTQRLWHHDRVVADTTVGCTVTDRVAWESRLPIPGGLMKPIFRAVFRYRHHRLKRRFG